MITLLTGENSFEIERTLTAIVADFAGQLERIDGNELESPQLLDLLMGVSLFADKRLVIIKNLSENKVVWLMLADWIGRVSDDIDLILVEPKPDKRTKTYKELQKLAKVQDFTSWNERDIRVAERWAVDEAKRLGFTLSATHARQLVERAGVDQWRLYHGLEKLGLFEDITPELIDDVIEQEPNETIFALLETALMGKRVQLHRQIEVLALSEDPYQAFGLLASQTVQLVTLVVTDSPSAQVARAIGAHPFVLSKLAGPARKLSRAQAKQVLETMMECDDAMKTSAAEPWLLIERALMKIGFSSD